MLIKVTVYREREYQENPLIFVPNEEDVENQAVGLILYPEPLFKRSVPQDWAPVLSESGAQALMQPQTVGGVAWEPPSHTTTQSLYSSHSSTAADPSSPIANM